ncbi:TetR family transcriptional regulator [Micromonospora arborensis]|uniref:TetR family transcriptional regulator n=1 Tax=Micromonospora arborensis TaxID=2116518 RepID=A0A318NHD8_9ACTN|nr:TetR/AcrR family transcriptional regulator [Micromonospora arborensis]PYC67732.1 TetR family transcriptional regulator [Micromonospora arborensis]
MLNKTRGRPRGNPDTKARIAEAARELFLERGYKGTTVRAVAAEAGVDSALISYHFGSKQRLFGQSLNLLCVESTALDQALQGDQAGLADRLLTSVTSLWDATAPTENRMALQDDDTMRAFRDYLESELLVRVAEFLGGPDATERATAAVGVIGGLIFTRSLNPIRSIAALPSAEVRRIFGPALRAALHARARQH